MLRRRVAPGFTLIELLVGIALMAALMLLGIPSFSSWLQSSQIRTAADAIENGVHLARAEAVRRNTPVNFQLTTTLDSTCARSVTGANWVISLDDPTGQCNAAPSADLAVPVAPRIVQVRPGTDGSKNATILASQSTITFNGLGRVTPVPAGNITIDIKNPNGGACAGLNGAGGPMRCMQVNVSATGQVRLCDPRFSASANPQGC